MSSLDTAYGTHALAQHKNQENIRMKTVQFSYIHQIRGAYLQHQVKANPSLPMHQLLGNAKRLSKKNAHQSITNAAINYTAQTI